MRGLLYQKGRLALVDDLPEPEPAEGEAVIRVILAGICATDLEISKGYMQFEGVLGHEFVGYVESPIDSEWTGTRVIGNINCGCGECAFCRDGLDRHCPNRTVMGILDRQGCFAEKITLPLNNLVKVPDGISDEEAVYSEPLAAVLRMADQDAVRPGDKVAVLGDGRMGLLCIGVGGVLGWDVTLVGKHPERAAIFGENLAILEPGRAPRASFDAAVDCTGSPSGMVEAMRLLKPQGRLVLKTTLADRGPLDLNRLVINEINLIGSRCGSLDKAVEFLSRGGFSPSVLTSARIPLSRGVEAFETAKSPETVKVLLEISEGI